MFAPNRDRKSNQAHSWIPCNQKQFVVLSNSERFLKNGSSTTGFLRHSNVGSTRTKATSDEMHRSTSGDKAAAISRGETATGQWFDRATWMALRLCGNLPEKPL